MLKFASLAISFFLGRYENTFKKSMLILIDQFITKSRKLFIVTTLLGIFSLLFVSGFLFSIFQITSQYDARGYVTFNSGLISGIALSLISLIALFSLFSASAWENRLKQQLLPVQPAANSKHSETPSAFENALTMLVVDFIKERESQRARKTNSFHQSSEPTHADKTHNPSHEVMN